MSDVPFSKRKYVVTVNGYDWTVSYSVIRKGLREAIAGGYSYRRDKEDDRNVSVRMMETIDFNSSDMMGIK